MSEVIKVEKMGGNDMFLRTEIRFYEDEVRHLGQSVSQEAVK